jgi:hypothetical protein
MRKKILFSKEKSLNGYIYSILKIKWDFSGKVPQPRAL